jgi:membrane associated rhomboid family serine protease
LRPSQPDPLFRHAVAGRATLVPATALLIGANLLGFGLELSAGPEVDLFLQRWGLVPQDLTTAGAAALVTLGTSLFLHAGWLHLFLNMTYLAVFGPPVERRLGGGRFALVYLVSGLVGSLAYVLTQPNSVAPAVGASGAIAGIIAAHLALEPGLSLGQPGPMLFLRLGGNAPTLMLLLAWMAAQLLSGVASLGSSTGIAWWAHVGGFATGLTLTPFLRQH